MEQPLTPRNREAAETIGRVLAPRGVSQRKIHPCSARSYPPFNFKDDKGNLTGFDVEIGRAIAAKLGVKPEFTTTEWSGILAGLQAGTSLGLTRDQTLRYVVGPQALRAAVPSLSNSLISLIKDTSLVSVIAVTELMLATRGLLVFSAISDGTQS